MLKSRKYMGGLSIFFTLNTNFPKLLTEKLVFALPQYVLGTEKL